VKTALRTPGPAGTAWLRVVRDPAGPVGTRMAVHGREPRRAPAVDIPGMRPARGE